MPTTHKIPERMERHCAPCEFHKLTGAMCVRIGPGGWREYACMHPDASNEDTSVSLTAEQQVLAAEIRALVGKDGRHIGRTEKQPEWCPLLRQPDNDQTEPQPT